MINLSARGSIQTSLFCKLDIPDYTPGPLLFSDYNRPIVIEGDTYTGLGTLLSISDSSSELRAVSGECSIGISGIPNTVIAEFLNNRIRGSSVEVWRALFDPVTSVLLPIAGNPLGRFQGIVNNFAIEEEYDYQSQTASCTIMIICTSTQEIIANKVSGRRTNLTDQQFWYPGDTSMDRVTKLSRTNLNWGAPS